MGLPDIAPNTDYRIATAGLKDSTVDIPEPAWYENAIPATVSGVASGVAAMGRMFTALGASASKGQLIQSRAWAPWQTQQLEQAIEQSKVQFRPIGDASFEAMQKWAEPDPTTTGWLGRTGHGVTRGLTIVSVGSLAGGPQVGAALLGATEAHASFQSLTEQGVDEQTALKVAGVQGATAWLGAALPMSVPGSASGSLAFLGAEAQAAGKTTLANFYRAASSAAKATGGHWASRIGTGIGVNNAMGMSSRGLTSMILEEAGHKEMADQYKVLDSEAIVADTILGAVFGSWQEATNLKEARRQLKASELPGPVEIDRALEVQVHAEEARGAAGVPKDVETAALDMDLQTRAREAAIKGNDFEITPEEAARVVEGSLFDPVKTQMVSEFSKMIYDQYGVRLGDEGPQPSRQIFSAQGEPLARVQPPDTLPVEGSVLGQHLSGEHIQTLDQIAQTSPDALITLPDQTVVEARDAKAFMEESMAKDLKDANLFDAAVACFLRGVAGNAS